MILKQKTPLQQRLIISIAGTFLVLMAIFFATAPAFKPLFVAFISAIIGIATWEFYQIAISKGLQPASTLGITLAVCYACAVALSTQQILFKMLPELVLLVSLLSCFL